MQNQSPLKPVWALYAALFVALLPMGLISPSIHSILNRSLAVVALVAWLLGGGRRLVWSATTSLMIGFFLWSSITLLWTENLDIGMTVLLGYALRFWVFLFLIPNLIRTQKELDGLMSTLALCGWVLLLTSAGVILHEGYSSGTRLQLLGENENALGMLALVTMLGVLWQAKAMQPSKQHGTRTRLMASIFLLMTIGLVAVSGSRGSAISLFITLLAFWFWRSTRHWGKLGLFVLVLAAIIAPFIFKTTFDRFAATIRDDALVEGEGPWQVEVPDTSLRRGDSFLGGREVLWQAGWQIISKRPLSGVGIGNSPLALARYFGYSVSVEGEDISGSMHNPIIVIWSETGLPGLMLFLGVLISAFWSFILQYQKHKSLGIQYLMPYFALVTSVFLGYMASWIKGGGMQSDRTFFLLLSILLIPSSLEIKGLESAEETDAQDIGSGPPSMKYLSPLQGLK